MRFKEVFAAIIIVVTLSVLAESSAGTRSDVKFARGSSSTTIEGAVVRGERDRYLLGAKAGQFMTVNIVSYEDNAVFDILLPGAIDSDETNIKGIVIGGAREARSATVRLPADGKYMIVVGGTRGNAGYKLIVGIADESPSQVAPSSSPPAKAQVGSTGVAPIFVRCHAIRKNEKSAVAVTIMYFSKDGRIASLFVPYSEGAAIGLMSSMSLGYFDVKNETFEIKYVTEISPGLTMDKVANERKASTEGQRWSFSGTAGGVQMFTMVQRKSSRDAAWSAPAPKLYDEICTQKDLTDPTVQQQMEIVLRSTKRFSAEFGQAIFGR